PPTGPLPWPSHRPCPRACGGPYTRAGIRSSGAGTAGYGRSVLDGVRHDGSMFRVRAAGLLLTAAYLAFVGWLLLRPHYVAWVPAPNLRPLGTIRADLDMSPLQTARRIGAGLGLLAPLGVLLPMAGGQ